MLKHLRIENFAIIDQLELDFQAGLVILTGETGAGKSIILDAIMALLGGAYEAGSVRAGASRSRVDAVFSLEDATADLMSLLETEDLLEDGGLLSIEREMRLEGRTSARINGRSVTQGVLRAVGDQLVDIHGQSEHLSLLNPKKHIALLDAYAGVDNSLREYQQVYRKLQETRRELKELRAMEQEAAARLELLTFQEQEITTARLQSGEDETLEQERNRLANAESLASAAQAALTLLEEGAPDLPPLTDLLGQLNHQLQTLARLDASRQDLLDASDTLLQEAEDLARSVNAYAAEIEFNPRRLEEIEDRIALINNLKRKYGGSIESCLSYLAATREKLQLIQSSGERGVELEVELQTLQGEAVRQADLLSAARHEAAVRMAAGIEGELGELRMEGARFEVGFETQPTENPEAALDSTGLDRVEFLIAPNPGEGLKPLAKVASGGETSRLMLALKNVLARQDRIPSLVFDEIDQGIGGRVGSIVGQKLWQLARHHQVFCVTHLPQLAAFGDQHFHVTKAQADGRTTTHVNELGGETRVAELAQMLGTSSENTMNSARELLQQVKDLR
jgi:DNA repair protein RecN (Recombination protein N)